MWTKKQVRIFAIILACAIAFATTAHAESPAALINDSIKVIQKMKSQKDAADMADVINGAHAIAFVPSMVKAGLIVGGEYGEGLILRKQNGKWYGPSFYNIGGGSFGLQIGAQKISLIFVVNNERGVEAFLNSKTKLGADVAIAAGPKGRRTEAATDAQARASIYSYSMTKGLFAGVSLEGAVISISVKRNKEFWKKNISAKDALNKRATDKRILPLIREIESFSKMAR